MKNLKCSLGFMVSLFLLSQIFFVPQGWCESSLKDMIMRAAQKSMDSKNVNNDQDKTITIPANSGYQNNSKSEGKKGSHSSHAKLVDDLGVCDLSTKCYTLKAVGATNAEVKILLVGKGYNPDDVNKALGGNKSNSLNTNNFLVNRSEDPLEDPATVPTKKVEIVDNDSEKSSTSEGSSNKGGLFRLISQKVTELRQKEDTSASKDSSNKGGLFRVILQKVTELRQKAAEYASTAGDNSHKGGLSGIIQRIMQNFYNPLTKV